MAVINTCMESLVAILPIPVIFNLQMEKRWSVLSLLSLGFLVTIVGCVRTYFVWKGFLDTYDITWWSEQHWICSEVENDLALVCFPSVLCLPPWRRPLLANDSDLHPC
jgi:hypothetical protein